MSSLSIAPWAGHGYRSKVNPFSYVPSFPWVVVASLSVAAATMTCAAAMHVSELPQTEAVFASWLSAQLACLPLILWLVQKAPNPNIKLAVIAWPLVRAALLYFGPDTEALLKIGDSMQFHEWGLFCSNHWSFGGSWVIPDQLLVAQGMKYIGVPYSFGALYAIFGPFPTVTIPWLAASQCLAAAIVLRLVEAIHETSYFEALYILYCPAWLFYSSALYRDTILLVGIVLFPLAALRITARRYASGLLAAIVASGIILAMRQQYFIVLAAFACIVLALGAKRRFKTTVVLLVATLGVTTWVSRRQIHDGVFMETLQRNVLLPNEISLSSGTRSFVERYGQLTPAMLPIAVPLRIVTAIVSPFPWINAEPPLVEQYGTWLNVGFHFSQAIFHIGIIVLLIVRWRRVRLALSRERKILLIWGLLILLSGSLTWAAFNRYVVPSFVFFLPALRVGAHTPRFKPIVLLGSVTVVALHALYYLLRFVL